MAATATTTAIRATAIMASSRFARARTWSSAALALLLSSCAALPPMPPPPPEHPASPDAEEAPPPPASAALAPRPSDDKTPAPHEHGTDMGGMR